MEPDEKCSSAGAHLLVIHSQEEQVHPGREWFLGPASCLFFSRNECASPSSSQRETYPWSKKAWFPLTASYIPDATSPAAGNHILSCFYHLFSKVLSTSWRKKSCKKYNAQWIELHKKCFTHGRQSLELLPKGLEAIWFPLLLGSHSFFISILEQEWGELLPHGCSSSGDPKPGRAGFHHWDLGHSCCLFYRVVGYRPSAMAMGWSDTIWRKYHILAQWWAQQWQWKMCYNNLPLEDWMGLERYLLQS